MHIDEAIAVVEELLARLKQEKADAEDEIKVSGWDSWTEGFRKLSFIIEWEPYGEHQGKIYHCDKPWKQHVDGHMLVIRQD